MNETMVEIVNAEEVIEAVAAFKSDHLFMPQEGKLVVSMCNPINRSFCFARYKISRQSSYEKINFSLEGNKLANSLVPENLKIFTWEVK